MLLFFAGASLAQNADEEECFDVDGTEVCVPRFPEDPPVTTPAPLIGGGGGGSNAENDPEVDDLNADGELSADGSKKLDQFDEAIDAMSLDKFSNGGVMLKRPESLKGLEEADIRSFQKLKSDEGVSQ